MAVDRTPDGSRPTLAGMRRVLDERARTVPELVEVASHPQYGELLAAKATELVAKRLAR